jgi:hypothetical protein
MTHDHDHVHAHDHHHHHEILTADSGPAERTAFYTFQLAEEVHRIQNDLNKIINPQVSYTEYILTFIIWYIAIMFILGLLGGFGSLGYYMMGTKSHSRRM